MTTRERFQSLHACACRHRGAGPSGFGGAGATDHFPPSLRIAPRHLDLDLTFDLDARELHGKVTHTLRAAVDGPDELRLHAVGMRDLEVRAVDHEGLTWRYDGQTLALRWERAYAADEERQVEIAYRVHEARGGIYFSKPSPRTPRATYWAMTDNETEKARHWLPTIDHPSVRPTLSFRVRASANFTALANGAFVGREEHGDGTATTRYELDHPCPAYLTCVVVGDLERVDAEPFGEQPIAFFGSKDFAPRHLQKTFGRTKEILEWITARLGRPYPFPKHFQCALPAVGGAMENISLVTWDDFFVVDEVLAEEIGWLVDVVNVHEIAHTYFGDQVVIRDYPHAWLKESWATFMELCWAEHTEGRDGLEYEFYSCLHSYLEEADDDYKRPIVTRTFDHSWRLYDRHLYPGGAARLRMLEGVIGEDAFWKGVELYLDRFAGKVVETVDLQRIMEETSGHSLEQFFEQWFRTASYPDLKVSFSHDAKRGEGTFTIEQKQAKDGKEPTFTFTTEVGWVAGGEAQRRTIEVERARQSFVFAMDEPTRVRIDPGHRLVAKVSFEPGSDLLLAQLREAPDAVGRLQAAKTLLSGGDSGDIDAVVEAYPNESFWGARVEMLEALGESGLAKAMHGLVKLLPGEEDPRVLPALLSALGEFRDSTVRDAVVARLEQGDLGYRARGAALRALGAQRADAPIELLIDACEQEGFGGIVQGNGFRGLAASRSPRALEVLLRHVEADATPLRSRPIAYEALGALARVLERGARERAIEALEAGLRDPEERIRMAAMNGMGAAGGAEAIAAVEAFRAQLPKQHHVEADGVLERLRGKARTDARAGELERELEELRAALRKVQERLDAVEATRER